MALTRKNAEWIEAVITDTFKPKAVSRKGVTEEGCESLSFFKEEIDGNGVFQLWQIEHHTKAKLLLKRSGTGIRVIIS